MIRMILAFAVVFAIFFFGISFVWHASGRAKLEMAKLIAYSTVCSVLALVTLVTIVVLF